MCKTDALPECKGCSYLSQRNQIAYGSDLTYLRPFCKYYQLHFDSVRQVESVEGVVCTHHHEE